MKDRSKTIEALRRVAERPGTPNEGEIAKRLLEQLGASFWNPRPFIASEWPKGTECYYCYWAYENDHGVIASPRGAPAVKVRRGESWMRIKFDRLKQPLWVPVTSPLGCHLGKVPFEGNEKTTLYRMDQDWKEKDRAFAERIRSLGWEMTPRIQQLLDELEGRERKTEIERLGVTHDFVVV